MSFWSEPVTKDFILGLGFGFAMGAIFVTVVVSLLR
jgi:hypothetical protein